MALDPKIDYDAAGVAIDALADLFDSGGTLTFYADDGDGIPTNADDAITNQTELIAITTPSPSFGAASNGVASLAGSWTDTVATGGTPGFFRLESGTSCFQGTVGTATSDLVFASVTWLLGGTVTISTFTVTLPRE
jgi:hypothetical protein